MQRLGDIDLRNPQSIVSAVQKRQKKANTANEQRYDQGLGVLQRAQQGITGAGGILPQAEANSRGAIMEALRNSSGVGETAQRRVSEQEQNARGATQQSAISRGLGNTTILDSLQRGVRRDANDARANIDEQVAARNADLWLRMAQNNAQFGQAQANATRGMAGDISQFIAARNDVGPSLNDYAGLIQQAMAAPDPNAPKRTSRVIGGSVFGGGGALGSSPFRAGWSK
jgi:hypothetical protein